jgi:hypothetical protein
VGDPTVVVLLLALGCTGEVEENELSLVAEDMPTMTESALLTRMSLDLRGIRPSAEELDAIEADPELLESQLDAYLSDPRFGARIMQMYAEITLTQVDSLALASLLPDLESEELFVATVGEEPLRILERIANEDLPYTEVVTGDWTMTHPLLADLWPVDTVPEDGWELAHYTDGRPAAGMLATNAFWWRYTSTDSNANRGRANQISRIFLCNDYLTRPIHFDRDLDLLDEDAVQDAIANNPACVNCHDSLDPLAASLFGFWTYGDQSWFDATIYHPDREWLWESYLSSGPSYYGTELSTVEELGQKIAADPRFPSCAVEQAFELMLRREPTLGDSDALTDHREIFIGSGMSLRSLFRSVAMDPRYQAADSAHEAIELFGGVPSKLVTIQLLGSQVEELTGFDWTYLDLDMLNNDVVGLRTLGGGTDGTSGSQSARLPNATMLLVQERLAEAAAGHVVDSDQELSAEARRLFTEIDFTETIDSDSDAIVRQIQVLQRAVLGRSVEAEGAEVEANLQLWSDLHAVSEDTSEAWAGLLLALLRDPDFLIY